MWGDTFNYMNHVQKTTYSGLASVQKYGTMLIVALAALHGAAFLAVRWIEKNEIRHDLAQWSQTLKKTDSTGPSKELHLPEDIIALHVTNLDQTGFYETYTNKGYLFYANPENNYILAKSEESIEREINNFAIMLGGLFLGELVLLLGWWRFVQSRVRELFEVV